MFKKLRNRLILINVGITSIILVTIFTGIYIVYTKAADKRPPIPVNGSYVLQSEGMDTLIIEIVEKEKEAAARELLLMLIVSGLLVELAVALVSYYLAEQAIKPVKEAYEAQKVFIANASHEIKTPLAAISANLEAADIRGNKWIANVEQETEKLTALNNELLTLARTDLVTERPLEEVDLRKLVGKEIAALTPRLKNHTFSKKIILSGKTKINREDFTQVLNILLDNAIKYSDSKIILFLDAHELKVANDGATISEKDLPHVFERFYQADKTSEGVGLGLSIAKSVAMRNGWELTASSNNKETEFCLKF